MKTDLTQEEIKYHNMCADLCSGDFRQYMKYPESVGNIVHWLRACGFRDYDRVQVGYNSKEGIGTVTFYGKVMATYRFVKNPMEMPVFQFSREYNNLQDRQDNFIANHGKIENPYQKYLV